MKPVVWALLLAAAALGGVLFLMTERPLDLPRPFTVERDLFDTSIAITVYDRDEETAKRSIDQAFAQIEAIQAVASATDASSELSELHRSNYLPVASDELVAMIHLAQIVHRVSDGAFDITGGTLTTLWESAAGRDVQTASIAEALAHVGMERIYLGSGRRTSVSLVPGTQIDLQGIDLGTAIDQAVWLLREANISSAIVRAGGLARAFGNKPDGSPWEIDLVDSTGATPVAHLHLTEGAVAAVGAFGRSAAPIPDPRTGALVAASLGSAVLAPTCAEAGALAVAAFILGPDDGIRLIERLGKTEALVAGKTPPRLVRSNGFSAFERASGT